MKTYAFTRELRLLTPADFQTVFDTRPKKFSCRYYTILASKSKFDKPRLGFTISKKKARFAVQRNTIKRVTRESFRKQQHDLPKVDMVFIAKQGIALASNETLRQELDYTWKKIKRHMKD